MALLNTHGRLICKRVVNFASVVNQNPSCKLKDGIQTKAAFTQRLKKALACTRWREIKERKQLSAVSLIAVDDVTSHSELITSEANVRVSENGTQNTSTFV